MVRTYTLTLPCAHYFLYIQKIFNIINTRYYKTFAILKTFNVIKCRRSSQKHNNTANLRLFFIFHLKLKAFFDFINNMKYKQQRPANIK